MLFLLLYKKIVHRVWVDAVWYHILAPTAVFTPDGELSHEALLSYLQRCNVVDVKASSQMWACPTHPV